LRFSLGSDRVATGKGRPHEPSLSLRLRGTGGLTIVLRKAGITLGERDLHVAQDDCSALANTVALMTEAWLTSPAAPRPAPPVTDPRITPSGTPASTAPAPIKAESPPEPGPVSPPERSLATPDPAIMASPVADAPVVPVEPADGPSPLAPVVVSAAKPLPELVPPSPALPAREPTPPVESRSDASVRSMTLAASLGGMAAMSRSMATVARISADLRLDRGRWLFGARGAAEDRADLDSSAGKLLARHIPASAYLGRAMGSGRLKLEILVGGGVDVVLASTSGYGNERTFVSVFPLIAAGVQTEWLVSRSFGVVAAGEILIALRRDQFFVANLGPVARTERVRAGLALGVAWHLR
jgi:hypothetical protein